MTDQLTDVLEDAAGRVPPAPPVLTLVKAGERRRRGKIAVGGVTAVAGLALVFGVASALPAAQPQIEPLTPAAPAAPAPNVVQATDGEVPLLPADAEPIEVDTRPLAGMGPEVRVAAVASDGRVAVSATGSNLAVAHPDDAAPTALSVPETIDHCGSIAFDAIGDLWALCRLATNDDSFEARLLHYRPAEVEPASYNVSGLIHEASPTARYALLWLEDERVRAVVPTDPPTREGEPPSWGNASAVTLVDGGELVPVEEATVRELPSLRTDTSSAMGATAGRRTIQGRSVGSGSLEIAWLTHETTARINTPIADWEHRGTRFSDAYIGSTIAGTYELSSTDRTVVYGVAADGEGTTSVMRLPTTAQGMPDLPDRPSPIPVTRLLPAPDGSVHVLTADEASLATAQVLPATP